MTGWIANEIAWPVVCIFAPLVLAIFAYALGRRAARTLAGAAAIGMPLFGLGLLIQVSQRGPIRYEIGGWASPLGVNLYADALSSLLVAMAAVVGSGISLYALGYFKPGQRGFWPVWFLVWAALNGLFLSADLFNIYVTLELLSLGSVILIALSGNAAALVATFRYLMLALMGSLLYLLGVALLYSEFGTLDIDLLGSRVTATPSIFAAQTAMTLGLLLKTALVPLHFWLPPAHSAAPAPVSALLSALIVKASFYLLVRLWWDVFGSAASVGVDQLLGLLGAVAIVWGSLQAIRAERLKLLVAYSTVAQIGYLFLLFPLAASMDSAASVLSGVVLLAMSHACAKAAAFMAAGTILKSAGHDRIAQLSGIGCKLPLAVFAFALAAVSLTGLPPSGGFSAKWLMLQAAIGNGQWHWVAVIVLGGLLAAVYLFRFLGRALQSPTEDQVAAPAVRLPVRFQLPALLLALIACGLGFMGGSVVDFIENGTALGSGELRP